MRDAKFYPPSDDLAALRLGVGCDDALDRAAAGQRGELCAAIDEIAAATPPTYARAAIRFVV